MRHFILALKSHNRNSSKHQFSKCFPHNMIILEHSHINSQNITFTWRDTLCVCVYISLCVCVYIYMCVCVCVCVCVCRGEWVWGCVCASVWAHTHRQSQARGQQIWNNWFFPFFHYYLFFVAQDLHFCARAFTSCSEQGLLFLAEHRL